MAQARVPLTHKEKLNNKVPEFLSIFNRKYDLL